jgi:hypothetical protein
MEKSDYPDEITFNIETNPEAGFYALFASLKMFAKSESEYTEQINKTAPEDKKVFSIHGAEAYCMLQSMLEENPFYYALAEAQFNAYQKEQLSKPKQK